MLFTPHLWLCSALARSVIAPAFDQSFDAGEAFGLRGHGTSASGRKTAAGPMYRSTSVP